MKPGVIVQVRFLDHSEVDDGDESELDFTVWGRLVASNRRSIVVEVWGYSDAARAGDQNCERFTIVKSAILSLHTLEPACAHPQPNETA